MRNSLKHRGPDASGTWRAEVKDGVALHLVHARLKILDLSEAAAQPMVRGRGAVPTNGTTAGSVAEARDQLVLVYNGEIYNYAVLREELKRRGHVFRSSGDTEVFLAGFAEWGIELFPKLDGMFAAAIYDSGNDRLILVRDHAGIKPLYFARTREGGIVFSSEVRAIVNTGLCDNRIEHGAIADFLRFGSFQEPQTLFREVRMLPPGHVGIVRLDEGIPAALVVQPYWLPERIPERPPPSLSSWRRGHRDRLAEAVQEQLVADVPLGVFLSGGVDSTLLMELAASAAGRDRIVAFTLGGSSTEHDEVHLASESARNAGVEHLTVRLKAEEIAEWVSGGLAAMDQPSADGLNTYLVSRAARAHGLVAVLSGTGADELHGAYGHARSLARVIRIFERAGRLRPLMGKAATAMLDLREGRVAGERLRELLACIPSSWRVLQEKRRFFTSSQMAELWPAKDLHLGWAPPFVDEEAFAERGLEEQIRLGEIRGYLLNTLLRDCDWATMANHQELRVPFLGRRYMDYVLGAPEEVTRSRGGLKPELVPMLSPSARKLALLPKRGFNLDFVSLLVGPMESELSRAAEALNDRLGFRIAAPALLLSLRQSRSQKEARRLWALLALGRYLSHHGTART
jgi:asparagine synthase (glutamine-hydrolysing)